MPAQDELSFSTRVQTLFDEEDTEASGCCAIHRL